jgi:3-carboxy-cis,cis-muconate cycloisomerase
MKNIQNIEPEYLLLKENLWQSYANVEAEMAKAQSQVGIIPKQAAIIIKKKSNFSKKNFAEVEKLQKKNKKTVLSIVKVLAKKSGESGGYVHWGGTTRNIIDTGNKLIFREIHRSILKELSISIRKLSIICKKNSDVPMMARTMAKNALPISFGFKIAGWLESLIRLDKRFISAEKNYFTLFFGGAVGAMHGYKNKGKKFTNQLAKNLGFSNSLVPNRVSLETSIDFINSLSFLGVVVGKISNDIYMLMQQSIDELSEKQGKNQIGSSTMPHKVNAYTIYQVLRDASLLRGKASGLSDSALTLFEGDSKNDFVLEEILKDSLILSFNLLKNFNLLLSKLIINKKKMLENLIKEKEYIASENIMYKLGKKIGRQRSHALINKTIKNSINNKKSIMSELLNNKEINGYINKKQMKKFLNPLDYLGESKSISLSTYIYSLKYLKNIQIRIKKRNLSVF